MRVQPHCIARTHYIGKRLTSLLFSCYNPLAAELPFSSVHKDKGANSSSRKKELAEPRSLTNINIILIENTNRIEIE
uniref:hypothetical chloroplast RF15 n=1 Tax=Callerya nitida var. hirsutissima TaxID=2795722 RepID=UPI001F14696E|nr:hypothetical chloroplast RF15 [Callerya nitida var. hirsutissima]ULQ68822.1 hypothetical chloroplast RF15 [Callerya nitida var. hirsutissima]